MRIFPRIAPAVGRGAERGCQTESLGSRFDPGGFTPRTDKSKGSGLIVCEFFQESHLRSAAGAERGCQTESLGSRFDPGGFTQRATTLGRPSHRRQLAFRERFGNLLYPASSADAESARRRARLERARPAAANATANPSASLRPVPPVRRARHSARRSDRPSESVRHLGRGNS